jgi:H+/Cl- antiporter ClcA
MSNFVLPNPQLWKQWPLWFGVAAGIYSIAYGLIARQFSFRSRAWWPGQERVKFTPKWYDRTLIVFVGLIVAIVSLCEILGLRLRP